MHLPSSAARSPPLTYTTPPQPCNNDPQQPKQRYHLGLLPTPIHRFTPPGAPPGVEIFIKRDDLSGSASNIFSLTPPSAC